MKRDIEQIWLTQKLGHIDRQFPNLDYFGPELSASKRQWKGYIDFETREIVLKLKLISGWRTFRAPFDAMCKLYRGTPTKGDAPDSE